MSEAKGQQEPSMEEILASIRRIISEDNDGRPAGEATAPAAEPEAAPAADDDVLELTQVVDETGTPVEAIQPPPEPVFEALEPEPEPLAEPEPLPVEIVPLPEPPRFETVMPASDPADRLISPETAAASTAAFAEIANQVRERRGGELLVGAGSVTVEEIVRELLRPLLSEWLDANLPTVVERLVREEIQRVSAASGR